MHSWESPLWTSHHFLTLCSGCISGAEIRNLPLALCLICWAWETSGPMQGPEEAPGRSQVGRRGQHCQCSDNLAPFFSTSRKAQALELQILSWELSIQNKD